MYFASLLLRMQEEQNKYHSSLNNISKLSLFRNNITVHTSRTMMFAELSKLMDHAMGEDNYSDFLNINVANKTTRSNQDKTAKYLQQLYVLDVSYLPVKVVKLLCHSFSGVLFLE